MQKVLCKRLTNKNVPEKSKNIVEERTRSAPSIICQNDFDEIYDLIIKMDSKMKAAMSKSVNYSK